MSGPSLWSGLAEKRVVVCVGPGGVGKTTLAAALALHAARSGQRCLVVTIDPAPRLAQSLGLHELDNTATRIPPDWFARAGLDPTGELWAMRLDVKRTFDELVLRHAPSPEQAERILTNRFYQSASTMLAGSHEYMAAEKLYELHEAGDFDLVVLDTPPSAHALDFLDAPQRILDAFGEGALRWIANPAVAAGRLGGKALGLGGMLLGHLAAFTGAETLSGLAELLLAMGGMYEGFKERAAKVKELLASTQAAFVLVTAPDGPSMDEALHVYGVLRLNEIPVVAVVANRAQIDWRGAAGNQELTAAELTADYPPDLAERLARTVAEQAILATAHRSLLARLASYLETDTTLGVVPLAERDVYDVEALAEMADRLFEGAGP